MKRVALILGLAVGLVAVVMLLLSMGDEDPSRQRLELALDPDGDSATTERASEEAAPKLVEMARADFDEINAGTDGG